MRAGSDQANGLIYEYKCGSEGVFLRLKTHFSTLIIVFTSFSRKWGELSKTEKFAPKQPLFCPA